MTDKLKAPMNDTQHTNSRYDDVLRKICDDKLSHVIQQKNLFPEDKLIDKLSSVAAPKGFIKAIKAKIASGQNAVIAEAKKASPSNGIIRKNFDPCDIAKSFEKGGAACISVLTDEKYFHGNDSYIKLVNEACKLPVLRKDFILDSYQVTESRYLGADCILLIMAALDDITAKKIESRAFALGMDVLIEVHNEEELKRALNLNSRLIGINNRNLKTLKIDLNTTEKLISMIPENYIIVTESGIDSFEDVQKMNRLGIHTFLIGSSLMKEENIEKKLSELLGKRHG